MYLVGLTEVLRRGVCEATDSHGGLQSDYRARQPRTASAEISTSGGFSTKHDTRDLRACSRDAEASITLQ